MKNKTQPLNLNSGDYLYQALMKGLNKKQRDFANSELKKAEMNSMELPIGLIRKMALLI